MSCPKTKQNKYLILLVLFVRLRVGRSIRWLPRVLARVKLNMLLQSHVYNLPTVSARWLYGRVSARRSDCRYRKKSRRGSMISVWEILGSYRVNWRNIGGTVDWWSYADVRWRISGQNSRLKYKYKLFYIEVFIQSHISTSINILSKKYTVTASICTIAFWCIHLNMTFFIITKQSKLITKRIQISFKLCQHPLKFSPHHIKCGPQTIIVMNCYMAYVYQGLEVL